MIVEMNGKICCALELPCCRPPANLDVREMQVQAIGEFLYKAANVTRSDKDDAFEHMARALLEHVILVPRQLLPKGEEPSQEVQPVTHTHPRLIKLHQTIKSEMGEISKELGYVAVPEAVQNKEK